MIIKPSIIQREFIGLEATVIKSSNPSIVSNSGRVVDETRNTFTILHDDKRKVVIKDTSVFDFVMPDGTVVEIDGKVLVGRSDDRIKRRPRRLW